MRIESTPRAHEVVDRVRTESAPGKVLTFVFGSGCCEGTAPHLFADYVITAEHQAVGDVAGVPVLADSHVRRLYDGRTVTIDVNRDELADGFSAEIPLGWRFVLRLG